MQIFGKFSLVFGRIGADLCNLSFTEPPPIADREPEAVREAEALLRVLDEQLLAVREGRRPNL